MTSLGANRTAVVSRRDLLAALGATTVGGWPLGRVVAQTSGPATRLSIAASRLIHLRPVPPGP